MSLDLLLSLTKSYEGFGLSIAEAMSVGTPVLATDVGGVNEFFNNECGKLIKFAKVEDIKNSLMDFCDNKKDFIDLCCINEEISSMNKTVQNILFGNIKFEDKSSQNPTEYKINNKNLKFIFPNLMEYKNPMGYWIYVKPKQKKWPYPYYLCKTDLLFMNL